MAFHHYHHWSHADAVQHTAIVSGWGNGLYVSHLFTIAWTADGLAQPRGYRGHAPVRAVVVAPYYAAPVWGYDPWFDGQWAYPYHYPYYYYGDPGGSLGGTPCV